MNTGCKRLQRECHPNPGGIRPCFCGPPWDREAATREKCIRIMYRSSEIATSTHRFNFMTNPFRGLAPFGEVRREFARRRVLTLLFMYEEHVSIERLWAFVRSGEELDRNERRHLDKCSYCVCALGLCIISDGPSAVEEKLREQFEGDEK